MELIKKILSKADHHFKQRCENNMRVMKRSEKGQVNYRL